MLQLPQFTLSILDPGSLLGSEVADALHKAFPSARRRFFHTLGEEEHLIVEVGGEAAIVPPLVDTGELDGTDVIVATATPSPAAAGSLLLWLRANPAVVLIDCTQPGIASGESLPALNAPPPGRTEARWFHLADPSLWGPGRLLQAVAPLRPQEAHVTVLRPASSFGETGVEELAKQAAGRLSGRPPGRPEALPSVLAFDLVPDTSRFRDVLMEQVLALFPDITFHLQLVHTGVFHGHAATVAIRCAAAATPARVAALCRRWPGLRVARRNESLQPSAVVGTDEVVCADIRCEADWLMAWVVADGLRVGGAQAVADILATVRAS